MAIEHKKILEGIIIKDAADQSKQLQIEVGASASTATKTILESTQTSDITLSLPSITDTLVGRETTDALTNKTIDADATGNVISNLADANIKAAAAIDATKLANGTVSNAEFQYLSNVTSDIQTQLNTNATGLSDHLSDTTDAHDASAISNIPSGNLAATDLQAAVNELQSDIDNRLLKAGDTMTGTLNMGANAVTSSYTPVSGSDLTNKTYVDGIAAGLDPKESVRVATTVSVGGSYATTPSNGRFTGAATSVDGVSLSVNDRVLIKDQVDQKQNGIYVYSASGEFTRSSDMDGSPASEVSGGNFVFVAEGSTNSASGYVLIANGTVTLNTDNLVFTQFSGGANSANKTLSNLDSPTSINQDLIPSASGTRNLGSTSRIWSTQYINNLNDSSDNTSVDVASRILRRGAGVQMFNWANAGELSAVNNKIINVANPTGLLHAENKQSVQALLQNFIPDGDAEGAQILTVYNDSSTTRPVDGTAGTQANLAVSISSSSPLAGTNSFLFSKTGSASTQGSGASIPFTIDAAYKAKVLQISFDYIVNSGTFVAGSSSAESDVIVYLYNVTDGVLLEPSSIKLLSNSSTISDRFIANFQTSSTATQYRLILHCQSSSTSNYELKLDNISCSPSSYVYGTPITDWVSYTPTITGLGTPSSQSFYTRRVGDTRQVKFILAAGTTDASLVSFTLPNSESIDSNKISPSTVVGKYNANTTTWNGGIFKGASNSLVYFGADGTAYTSGYAGNNFANGTTFGGFFEVPIAGWSSSVQVSDGYDARLIDFLGLFNSGTHTSTGNWQAAPNFTSIVIDTVASSSTSTNAVTIMSSGRYKISGKADFVTNGTGSRGARITKNGTAINGSAVISPSSSASFGTAALTNIEADLVAGDLIRLEGFQNSGGSLNWNNGTDAQSFLIVTKLSAPTTMSATEEVIFSATKNGTQAIVNSAKITSLTAVKDTHAGWDSTNNRYNIQYAGSYMITQQHAFSGNTSSGITAFKINNGTTYFMGTAASTDKLGASMLIPVKLVQGDYIEFYANPNNSVTLNAGTTDTWFGIHKVK